MDHHAPDTIALLAAPDELALTWLLADLDREAICHVAFREPDLDFALTAVAAGPLAARICSRYPLALKG